MWYPPDELVLRSGTSEEEAETHSEVGGSTTYPDIRRLGYWTGTDKLWAQSSLHCLRWSNRILSSFLTWGLDAHSDIR